MCFSKDDIILMKLGKDILSMGDSGRPAGNRAGALPAVI